MGILGSTAGREQILLGAEQNSKYKCSSKFLARG